MECEKNHHEPDESNKPKRDDEYCEHVRLRFASELHHINTAGRKGAQPASEVEPGSRALDHAVEAAGSGIVYVQVGNGFICEEVSNRLF